jgi:hypothetical protein
VAKPIEATPPVTGEEAEELLRQLKVVCSPEEAARRLEMAQRYWETNVVSADWRPDNDANN